MGVWRQQHPHARCQRMDRDTALRRGLRCPSRSKHSQTLHHHHRKRDPRCDFFCCTATTCVLFFLITGPELGISRGRPSEHTASGFRLNPSSASPLGVSVPVPEPFRGDSHAVPVQYTAPRQKVFSSDHVPLSGDPVAMQLHRKFGAGGASTPIEKEALHVKQD